MLNIIKSGFFTTVQDSGRFGYRDKGVPVAGVMDSYTVSKLNSLLENARKYSRDEIRIALTAFKEKNSLVIRVSDQGIGIAEEGQKKVFEKYFRVANGDLHDVKGYGLGLHYVKRIVNLHGGKIEVESEVGKGSTFTLTFQQPKLQSQP